MSEMRFHLTEEPDEAAREAGRLLFAGPVDFVKGVVAMSGLPPADRLEVCFAGRSNVGKSSLINALTGRKNLARASNTPGRTQEINFFSLGDPSRAGDLRYLVDLPGYGYAEVPAPIRAHWGRVLGDYLQTRASLIGLILIMDSRHPLKDLDWQMIDWFAPTGKPIHVLLTKSDKLSNQQASQTLRQVRAELAEHENISVQLFSSLKKTGVDETEKVVGAWFASHDGPLGTDDTTAEKDFEQDLPEA